MGLELRGRSRKPHGNFLFDICWPKPISRRQATMHAVTDRQRGKAHNDKFRLVKCLESLLDLTIYLSVMVSTECTDPRLQSVGLLSRRILSSKTECIAHKLGLKYRVERDTDYLFCLHLTLCSIFEEQTAMHIGTNGRFVQRARECACSWINSTTEKCRLPTSVDKVMRFYHSLLTKWHVWPACEAGTLNMIYSGQHSL